MTVISFVSLKGGVGKTTLALETASSLANDFDKRVLLVDANFSAPNIGLYLDMTHETSLHDALLGVGLHNAIYEAHGFDVVPAAMNYKEDIDALKLKSVLSKVRNRYDYIIIDSSPHYSEMLPVIAASDKIFVVTSPDNVNLMTSLKAAVMARQRNTPVEGVIVNRIRDPKHEMDLEHVEKVMKMPVVAKIHDHKGILGAMFNKTPLNVYDSENIISKEIRKFASALVGSPEEPVGFFQRLLPFRNLFHKEVVNRELLRKRFYDEQL